MFKIFSVRSCTIGCELQIKIFPSFTFIPTEKYENFEINFYFLRNVKTLLSLSFLFFMDPFGRIIIFLEAMGQVSRKFQEKRLQTFKTEMFK